MSVKKLVQTRNIFFNTDSAQQGDGRSASYNLPQSTLHCNENQCMTLTLSSFNMRQGWYRINQHNNKFWVFGADNTSTPANKLAGTLVTLPEGDYQQFSTVGGAAGADLRITSATPAMTATAPATATPNLQTIEWTHAGTTTPTKPVYWGYYGDGQTVTRFLAGSTPENTVIGKILHAYNPGYPVTATYPGHGPPDGPNTYRLVVELDDSATILAVNDEIAFDFETYETSGILTQAIVYALRQARSKAYGATATSMYNEVNASFQASTKAIQLEITSTDAYTDNGDSTLKVVGFYETDETINPTLKSIIDHFGIEGQESRQQNSYEILGGCYSKTSAANLAELTELLVSSKPSFALANQKYYLSSYKATLQSEECIYLRTNLQGNNYQTTGFDLGGGVIPEIQNSRILAKIPLNNPVFASTLGTVAGAFSNYSYQRPYELINYTDNGNNLYSLMLDTKKVNYLTLAITDSYGRLLPATAEQTQCKALSFSCDLRVDVYEEMPITPHDVATQTY